MRLNQFQAATKAIAANRNAKGREHPNLIRVITLDGGEANGLWTIHPGELLQIGDETFIDLAAVVAIQNLDRS